MGKITMLVMFTFTAGIVSNLTWTWDWLDDHVNWPLLFIISLTILLVVTLRKAQQINPD
jgi:hypothetical protein